MAATNGTLLGVFEGTAIGVTFGNKDNNFAGGQSDLLHIVGPGKQVLMQVTSAGVVNTSPANSTVTHGASIGSFQIPNGTTVAASPTATQIMSYMFPINYNGQQLDIFQVYSEINAPAASGSGGQVLIGRLNYAGAYSTT
jgi:hypothetical protein